MKTNKPLVAKTPLQAKTTLKANAKPKKQVKPTVTKLKKEAITWFNRAIKYRDSEYIEGQLLLQCITCNRRVLFRDRDGRFNRAAQAGHYQSKRLENTRFNELNVNGQCGSCNEFYEGEQVKYSRALELKYGDGTAAELEEISRVKKNWTADELQVIIDEYKEQCRWYENEGMFHVRPL